MVLWDKIATEIALEFPSVTVDKMLVDAMTTRMVLKPETLDTIVATNLVSCVKTLASIRQLIEFSSMQTFFRILRLLWLVLSV